MANTDPEPADVRSEERCDPADRSLIEWVDGPEACSWDVESHVLVVGGGACGLVAALRVAEASIPVLLLERAGRLGGNTNLSQGMIPAAGTAAQRRAGVTDSVGRMAEDILAKHKARADAGRVHRLCAEAAPMLDWLAEAHDIRLDAVTDFLYPGFSHPHIHAPATRKGTALVSMLAAALARQPSAEVALNAHASALIAHRCGVTAPPTVLGACVTIPGQGTARVRAQRVILACNGFGANRALVQRWIPAMAGALYMGHAGNTGEGILWGMALGAATDHLGAYQAHGSVAHPQGILLTWAIVAKGGCQVNIAGQRFANEYTGYSEHALDVLRQPQGCAIEIYDRRIHDGVLAFEDYRTCVAAGAVRSADSAEGLAGQFQIPAGALRGTLEQFQAHAEGRSRDPWGRSHFEAPLRPAYYGVRVTGALFHTQGGLRVDDHARVLWPDSRPIPWLYAGGGVAAGISGDGPEGYLSGNGLLTATVLGWLAGSHARDEPIP